VFDGEFAKDESSSLSTSILLNPGHCPEFRIFFPENFVNVNVCEVCKKGSLKGVTMKYLYLVLLLCFGAVFAYPPVVTEDQSMKFQNPYSRPYTHPYERTYAYRYTQRYRQLYSQYYTQPYEHYYHYQPYFQPHYEW
jgi:hypothetical protein